MSHNARYVIVCMNFINIGRDGIIVKQIFAEIDRAILTAPQGGPGVPESVAIPVLLVQKHDLRVIIVRLDRQEGTGKRSNRGYAVGNVEGLLHSDSAPQHRLGKAYSGRSCGDIRWQANREWISS